MNRSLALLLASALGAAPAGCRRANVQDAAKPATSTEERTAPRASAPSAPAASCQHQRALNEFETEKQVALPAPFVGFSACDTLRGIFADYDPQSEKSRAAGGTVRLDAARLWNTSGRKLLAVTYYAGAEADETFVCGQCRVTTQLAVLEQRGPVLALVAKAPQRWHPEPEIEALFDGRSEFDTTEYRVVGDETLLGLRTPWSTGMPGVWTNLTLYRLRDGAISIVFSSQVEWWANGQAEDDEVVISSVSVGGTPAGVGTIADLVVDNGVKRCHLDDRGDKQCGAPRAMGKERWRFDGKAYERIEGRAAPLPRILKKLWGW